MHPFFRTGRKPQSRQETIPTVQPRTAASGPVASLQGDIGAIPVENVFQLLDFAALTGKLEIQVKDNSGIFYFRKGMLIHGLLKANQRKIGQILLDAQAITEEQLQECLQSYKQSGSRQRFGKFLLDKGYAQPYLLDKSLLNQIKEAFFEALSWNEGSFKFYVGQEPAPDEIQMYGRIDRLLLEGMVHIDHVSSTEEDGVA
ncbi:MAG: DUF4388 domain-containing protein [Desulfobulbus sp.]|jgi:hypothetical protein|uniref:DUF4388 domain-containing protein n=1 Tax=Desulfobulbus sp. TaxID=895 RepID=UPI00284FF100|nr:DUF4388 domain-containing protein [Desulfobulbus sp.]MDR2549707.1 DUF4388 domain-containing protein [Desulfobulbus sp.]